MNRDNAHLYAPLVQALAAGQTIQANRGTVEEPRWEDLPEWVLFTCEPHLYRVKPGEAAQRTPPGTCESAAPDCGPPVFEDDDGVPLCQKCYDELETETRTQRRVRESGLSVVGASGKPA